MHGVCSWRCDHPFALPGLTAIRWAVMSLSLTALEVAVSQLGVHEQGGNNTGPEVDQYLASVGLNPGYAWCASFLYWCFRQAIQRRPIDLAPGVDYFPPPNPCPRTGSALKLWKLSDMAWRDSNPAPGAVYVLDHGKGVGHAGIVETADSTGVLTEISGNTNAAGSREGNCVYRHNGPPEVSHGGVLLGFIYLDRALSAAPAVS